VKKDIKLDHCPTVVWGCHWLVWNMAFIFHNIWDVILPIDEQFPVILDSEVLILDELEAPQT